MSTSGGGKGGRPSKGPRKSRMFRYPHPLDKALQRATADSETAADVQDLMIEILTAHMIERGYLPAPDEHQESERPLMVAS